MIRLSGRCQRLCHLFKQSHLAPEGHFLATSPKILLCHHHVLSPTKFVKSYVCNITYTLDNKSCPLHSYFFCRLTVNMSKTNGNAECNTRFIPKTYAIPNDQPYVALDARTAFEKLTEREQLYAHYIARYFKVNFSYKVCNFIYFLNLFLEPHFMAVLLFYYKRLLNLPTFSVYFSVLIMANLLRNSKLQWLEKMESQKRIFCLS